ncbi:hypothetical protein ETD86_37275 [Nonomuraea turkmeniaca]|uniref:Uncharacterized protein n=1 Tax=Nonomuraea turkmeniaca TaxID=103838 RepID=A0A5S4F4R7_9ACTN|nr:hypothetical protein [Nonomuraea turkmeniaca]TMR10971.1 hypothetical protein ETD86_37275 [Nonomuraea turkmeniaca]
MNELDPASREQFDEMLISDAVRFWEKVQGRPNEARAFLDTAVAALGREQERTKLRQAVLRHIIGMGMKRLRDEGVEVKQIVSRTRLGDQSGKPVSRAWVDKHMLTDGQMADIVDAFARAEQAYDALANDTEAFSATRAQARRTGNQLRALMRWIGVRLSGVAAVASVTWVVAKYGVELDTITLAAGGFMAAAVASRVAAAPTVPGLEQATVHLGNGAGSGLSSLSSVWSGTTQAGSVASAGATSSGPVATAMTKVTVGVVTSVEVFAGVSAPVATTLVVVPPAIAAAPAAHQAAEDVTNSWPDLFAEQPGDPALLTYTSPTPSPTLVEDIDEPDAEATPTPSPTASAASPSGAVASSPAVTSQSPSSSPAATKPQTTPTTADTVTPTMTAKPTSADTPTPQVHTDPGVVPSPSPSTPSSSSTSTPDLPSTPTPTPSPSPSSTYTPTTEPTLSPTPTAVPDPLTQTPAGPPTGSPSPAASPSELLATMPTSAPSPSIETPSLNGDSLGVQQDAGPPPGDLTVIR